jgi:Domain of unknown function (DUF4399)
MKTFIEKLGLSPWASRGLIAVVAIAALSGCSSVKQSMTNMVRGPAEVEFVSPRDGDTISGPVMVKFGVKGMDVKPAGEEIENKRAGHHHVLINQAPIKAGEAIPFTDQHIHFGKGQTEAEIKLPPGRYRMTLQFANGAHVSYGEGLSHTINIVVR